MVTGLFDRDIPEVTSGDSSERISYALAAAFVQREANFMNFSRYEASLSRAFDRALKRLLAVRGKGPARAANADMTDDSQPRRGSVLHESEKDQEKPLPQIRRS